MTQVCKSCCAELAELLSPEFFRALCDPNRLRILCRLAELGEPSTVGRVADCCPVDLSVVSRHLSLLRDAGVLSAEKRGKEVYYRVRVAEVVSLLRACADALEACCPGSTTHNTRRGGAAEDRRRTHDE